MSDESIKESTSNSSMDCLSLDFSPSFEATNCWKKMPDCDKFVGAPRSKHTVVSYKDAIYVFGGDNGQKMLNDLLRFDVKEKSWCTCRGSNAAPTPRYHHSAVVYNNSMLVFGGYTGDIHSNSNLTNRNDLWEYKFDTTQWVEWKTGPTSNVPVPRSAHGAACYDGMLYIFAGFDGNARLNDMWRISLTANTYASPMQSKDQPGSPPPAANQQLRRWEQVEYFGESPPTCCNFPVAVSRGSMFVFSGQTGAQVTNSLFQFQFASQTWTRISTEHILRDVPNPPRSRYGHTMVAFDRHLYVFGGAADNILPNEIYDYDLEDQLWQVLDQGGQLPSGRLFHAATIVGDAMYVFGGTIDNNIRSGEMFRFQLSNFPRCTLHEDIGKLLKKELQFSCDLTFIVGVHEIPIMAHCSIIAARCKWLRELIVTAKQERLKNQEKTEEEDSNQHLMVRLKDADASAFNLVLEYIYTDKIDPTNGSRSLSYSNEVVLDIMRVYTLAWKFQLKNLEDLCVRWIESSINLKNVLAALTNASAMKLLPIKEFFLRFIVKESNYKQIVMSEEFETLEQPLMIEIIRRREQISAKDSNDSTINKPPSAPKNVSSDSKSKSTLTSDLKNFLCYSGSDFADIELVLEGAVIPAHKAILCARSSYFEGMFRSFKQNNDPVPISIGEMIPSEQSFHSLMKYIYFGETQMPPEDSLYLFTAHAYYLFSNNRLQVFCKHNLERNVSSENVIQILVAADKSQTQCQVVKNFKQVALNLIVKNFNQVVYQPAFSNLSRELLLDILYAMAEVKSTPISGQPEGGRLFQDLSLMSLNQD